MPLYQYKRHAGEYVATVNSHSWERWSYDSSRLLVHVHLHAVVGYRLPWCGSGIRGWRFVGRRHRRRQRLSECMAHRDDFLLLFDDNFLRDEA
jgi:hypothetical protein